MILIPQGIKFSEELQTLDIFLFAMTYYSKTGLTYQQHQL